MLGSIDKLPLILRGDFGQTLLILLGGVFLLALGVVLSLADTTPLVSLAAILFSGLCIIAGTVRVLKPVYVEISPVGIAWFDGWMKRDFSWSDFDEFRIVRVRRSKWVGFNLAPGSKQILLLKAVNRSIANIDGTLPAGLEIEPDDLAEFVKAASLKWSRTSGS